jgi:hypothetical protein
VPLHAAGSQAAMSCRFWKWQSWSRADNPSLVWLKSPWHPHFRTRHLQL